MAIPDHVGSISIYWLVGLILLFLGILYWAFRPKNKRRFERDAGIPLRDEDGERRPK